MRDIMYSSIRPFYYWKTQIAGLSDYTCDYSSSVNESLTYYQITKYKAGSNSMFCISIFKTQTLINPYTIFSSALFRNISQDSDYMYYCRI